MPFIFFCCDVQNSPFNWCWREIPAVLMALERFKKRFYFRRSPSRWPRLQFSTHLKENPWRLMSLNVYSYIVNSSFFFGEGGPDSWMFSAKNDSRITHNLEILGFYWQLKAINSTGSFYSISYMIKRSQIK